MLRESDFYAGVNSLRTTALALANRCHRQLTDLEFLQCVAEHYGVAQFAEKMLREHPETFFQRYGHEPECLRKEVPSNA